MQAETRGDWLYSCHTKLAVIGSKYSSTVYAYSDRVEIHREGKTALPKDMTLFFDDITVISGGNSSGRSWISFSVPGMFNAGRGVVTAAKPGQIVIAGPTIPYDDPCTVMYGLGEKREAEEDCRQINEIFMTYKAESRKRKEVGAPSIMQESALDQLKKLKELFDMGVITEAEYNEKREKRMKDI